jgi:hypothetical protein
MGRHLVDRFDLADHRAFQVRRFRDAAAFVADELRNRTFSSPCERLGAQLPEQFEGGPNDTLSTTFTSGTESTTAPSTLAIRGETGHNAAPLEIKAKGG